MRSRQPRTPIPALPRLWLLTDRRNDAVLDEAVAALPFGSGVVFRHYHLDEVERWARFQALAGLCERLGHVPVLSGDAETARAWGAAGHYGARRGRRIAGQLWLATVHDMAELGRANREAADAALLSPVFATRSHENAAPLGIAGCAALARRSFAPVIALGGMDGRKFSRLPRSIYGWAAIDGLSGAETSVQEYP